VTTKTVSVVITNYNYGRFLNDAIRSALKQSRAALEVVVVDDGSVDDSPAIVASWGDRIVPVLKDNGGQASAFAAGFDASSGDVIIFLDSDDMLFPHAVEDVATLFDDRDVVRAQWYLEAIDARGRRLGRLHPEEELVQGDLRLRMAELGPGAVPTPPTSGNAWSRWFLGQCLPMPETEYRISADFYLVQISSAFGSIRTSPRPLGALRLHRSNSYSTLPLEEKNRNDQIRYEDMCRRLGECLETLDLAVDPRGWTERSGWYKRMMRLDQSLSRVRKLIPAGETFALADDGVWLRDGPTTVFADRTTIPFFPSVRRGDDLPGDVAAIRELEALRNRGIRFIVFAWPGTRWLRERPGLHDYLRTTARAVHQPEPTVFDLHSVPSTSGSPLPRWLPPATRTVTMEGRSSATPAGRFELPLYRSGVNERGLIRLLEGHRKAGAEFLVLPSSLRWWLDCHEGVASHVERTYGPRIEDGDFVVYKLQAPPRPTPLRRRVRLFARGAAG
jgi:glycosyltransferase involved in cell wall biosynthesis